MRLFKRPKSLYFLLEEKKVVNLFKLLQGTVEKHPVSQLNAALPHQPEPVELRREEFDFLHKIPAARWLSVESLEEEFGISPDTVLALAEKGLLLSDPELETAFPKAHDEALVSGPWHPLALLYHSNSTTWYQNRVDAVGPREDLESIEQAAHQRANEFAESFGAPPSPFSAAAATLGNTHALPQEVSHQSPLTELLERRRTRRAFDPSQALSREVFSDLLGYTFGFRSETNLGKSVTLMGRTSPSGGSLHPIGIYPLVLRVEGLEPGIYHYRAQDHAVELVESLPLEKAEALAGAAAAGQDFTRSASVLFCMVARFDRIGWKYRANPRAYSVVLMDAGHLSQTFLLLAEDMGLAAFYTGAVGFKDLEERLSLRPFREGAVGICGCGIRGSGDETDLGLQRKPWQPRSSTDS